MVDELREWNEGLVNDLADSNETLSRTTHVPVLPVSAPTEIASSSGDISSLVSKAVALALKEHMGKKALPVIKNGIHPSRAEHFDIASDGGGGGDDDDDDDDDDDESEGDDYYYEEEEKEEEPDGREPTITILP
eukprot:4546064-Heterocapsa_arctica.AAC.1